MPTTKIGDVPKCDYCDHPDHEPSRVLPPGIYRHECPACGNVTVFTVEGFRKNREQRRDEPWTDTGYRSPWSNHRPWPDPWPARRG